MRGILSGSETSFSVELRCRHHQGIDVWVSLNGSLFTARPPLSRCLILQLQDITARRRAESRTAHRVPRRAYESAEPQLFRRAAHPCYRGCSGIRA
jgi:hypothetical protein